MDIGTIVTSGIILIIITLPFIGMQIKKKRKSKEIYQELTVLAAKEKCVLTAHEIMGGIGLGIDESANNFFYVRHHPNRFEVSVVHLNKVVKAEMIKKERTIENAITPFKVIDKLQLRLVGANEMEKSYKLSFYNADEDIQLAGEYHLLERWTDILTSRLKKSSE
jgi:hypothetical protein